MKSAVVLCSVASLAALVARSGGGHGLPISIDADGGPAGGNHETYEGTSRSAFSGNALANRSVHDHAGRDCSEGIRWIAHEQFGNRRGSGDLAGMRELETR